MTFCLTLIRGILLSELKSVVLQHFMLPVAIIDIVLAKLICLLEQPFLAES